MTPVRIRGKRGGTKVEKWTSGKERRKRVTNDPSSSSAMTPRLTSHGPQLHPRKRKRRGIELSSLEQLPTEIIQAIFVYTATISLPFASPVLMAQLSDRRVCEMLTARILQSILHRCSAPICTHVLPSADIAAASRLFDCNFMTWSFFRDWLDVMREKASIVESSAGHGALLNHYSTVWQSLGPPGELLPPRKLLHGPWSDDRAVFLGVLTSNMASLPDENSVLGEVAFEGLTQAIAEGHSYAVEMLLHLGIVPNTQTLQHAVVDAGCNREIVLQLMKVGREVNSVDFLDPALWSWAERARAEGDDQGAWLVANLKKCGGTHVPGTRKIKRRQP